MASPSSQRSSGTRWPRLSSTRRSQARPACDCCATGSPPSPDCKGLIVSSFELLPAVDVADGQAVRLVQGEAGSETSYGDPLEAALAWQRDGAEWVHLVDLDAAFGRGSNRELLARVVGELDVDRSEERRVGKERGW